MLIVTFFNLKNHFHWGHEWPGCQNLIVVGGILVTYGSTRQNGLGWGRGLNVPSEAAGRKPLSTQGKAVGVYGWKAVAVRTLGRRTRLWVPITGGNWCFVASDHSRNLGVTSSGHSKNTDRRGTGLHTAWCLGEMTDAVVATTTTATTGRWGVTFVAS